MNDYFQGAIRQQIERGQQLVTRIPTNLSREFHLLAQTCRIEISKSLDELKALLDDPRMQNPLNATDRLREFKRIVSRMTFFETTAIAALERSNDSDKFLNQLVEGIRKEINYPLLPPVVSSLSDQYFHIFTQLNLLRVPLSESNFLLHLPDLYHELAHPLVVEKHNPLMKPLQQNLDKAITEALQYISNEIKKEERRRGPGRLSIYLRVWSQSWWKWSVELFCDLFAVYTIGPAYAWSHLHLCAKLGSDPYLVPTYAPKSHPADDARMKTILYALDSIGFEDVSRAIRVRWDELLSITGSQREPEYSRCYPDALLKGIADLARDGVVAIGCRIASPQTNDMIHKTLNEAWEHFWDDPDQYVKWEGEQTRQLKVYLSAS